MILASFLPHGWFNPTLQASDSEIEEYDNYTFMVFAKSCNFFLKQLLTLPFQHRLRKWFIRKCWFWNCTLSLQKYHITYAMQHMFGLILLKINISSINRFLCIFSESFEHEEIYKWIVCSGWLCKKANKNSIKFGYLLKIENEILGILFYFYCFYINDNCNFPCQRMRKVTLVLF